MQNKKKAQQQAQRNRQCVQRECTICTQHNKQAIALVQPRIHARYFDAFNFYFAKPINEILANVALPHVIYFKYSLYLAEENEYLKRYYRLEEVAPRLKILTDFYHTQYRATFASLLGTDCNRIMAKRVSRHTKLFYARNAPAQNDAGGGGGVAIAAQEQDAQQDRYRVHPPQTQREHEEKILNSNLSLEEFDSRGIQVEEGSSEEGQRRSRNSNVYEGQQNAQQEEEDDDADNDDEEGVVEEGDADFLTIRNSQESGKHKNGLRAHISYDTDAHDIYNPSFSVGFSGLLASQTQSYTNEQAAAENNRYIARASNHTGGSTAVSVRGKYECPYEDVFREFLLGIDETADVFATSANAVFATDQQSQYMAQTARSNMYSNGFANCKAPEQADQSNTQQKHARQGMTVRVAQKEDSATRAAVKKQVVSTSREGHLQTSSVPGIAIDPDVWKKNTLKLKLKQQQQQSQIQLPSARKTASETVAIPLQSLLHKQKTSLNNKNQQISATEREEMLASARNGAYQQYVYGSQIPPAATKSDVEGSQLLSSSRQWRGFAEGGVQTEREGVLPAYNPRVSTASKLLLHTNGAKQSQQLYHAQGNAATNGAPAERQTARTEQDLPTSKHHAPALLFLPDSNTVRTELSQRHAEQQQYQAVKQFLTKEFLKSYTKQQSKQQQAPQLSNSIVKTMLKQFQNKKITNSQVVLSGKWQTSNEEGPSLTDSAGQAQQQHYEKQLAQAKRSSAKQRLAAAAPASVLFYASEAKQKRRDSRFNQKAQGATTTAASTVKIQRQILLEAPQSLGGGNSNSIHATAALNPSNSLKSLHQVKFVYKHCNNNLVRAAQDSRSINTSKSISSAHSNNRLSLVHQQAPPAALSMHPTAHSRNNVNKFAAQQLLQFTQTLAAPSSSTKKFPTPTRNKYTLIGEDSTTKFQVASPRSTSQQEGWKTKLSPTTDTPLNKYHKIQHKFQGLNSRQALSK